MSKSQVEPSFEETLTDDDRKLLIKLADKIVRLRMTMPAILFLESVRPMNYVGSQVMVFFTPLIRVFFELPEWDQLRQILERRQSVAHFLDLLDDYESKYLTEEQKRKAERKALKKLEGNSGGIKGLFRKVFRKDTDPTEES